MTCTSGFRNQLNTACALVPTVLLFLSYSLTSKFWTIQLFNRTSKCWTKSYNGSRHHYYTILDETLDWQYAGNKIRFPCKTNVRVIIVPDSFRVSIAHPTWIYWTVSISKRNPIFFSIKLQSDMLTDPRLNSSNQGLNHAIFLQIVEERATIDGYNYWSGIEISGQH